MIEKNFWNEMRRMHRKMNRFFKYPDFFESEFEEQGNFRRPRADFRETDDGYLIAVEIPGVSKEEINIEILDNQLVIKAEKKVEKKQEADDRCECSDDRCECSDDRCECYSYAKAFAGFYRAVGLPENADVDEIDAVYENGVLKVKIGKKKSAKEKKFVKIR